MNRANAVSVDITCAQQTGDMSAINGLIQYLAHSGHSAEWLGTVTVNDPTFIQGLFQGFTYAPGRMIALFQHIVGYYQQQLAKEADATAFAV